MFRLFAIALVVVAFGATLYYSGETLEAWESPKPSAKAAPDTHRKGKSQKRKSLVSRKQARRPASKPHPMWLARLNTLCRNSEAQAAAIPPPITAEGSAEYLRQVVKVARRFNRKAETLLRGDANPQSARELERLFAEEERLMQSLLSAAERRQFERVTDLMPALTRVGKSENRVLHGLGARDCTVSEDAFQL
jgi:hypothetical protein